MNLRAETTPTMTLRATGREVNVRGRRFVFQPLNNNDQTAGTS